MPSPAAQTSNDDWWPLTDGVSLMHWVIVRDL
jgi:hypothetical protein